MSTELKASYHYPVRKLQNIALNSFIERNEIHLKKEEFFPQTI